MLVLGSERGFFETESGRAVSLLGGHVLAERTIGVPEVENGGVPPSLRKEEEELKVEGLKREAKG